jgi:L-lactate dehydrogenase complex protein LldE
MSLHVQLLTTCLVDSLFPGVARAAYQCLRRIGATISIPVRQTCCGQPAFNAGLHDLARRMAIHTIQEFEKGGGPIVVLGGSCTHMIHSGYAELFPPGDPWRERAEALSRRTFEFSQFLAPRWPKQETGYPHARHIAYHPSCHLLRGLGVQEEPPQLLASLPDLHLEVLPPDCCGFGGLFSLQYGELAGQMARHRADQILASGATVVAGADVSCLMQLEGTLRRMGSPVRCAHLAQILNGDPPGLQ